MNLQAIINAAADEADDFLCGITSPSEAKPAIVEWLADNHPELAGPEKQAVVQGLLAVLEREGFFEASAGGEGDDTADLEAE